VSETSLRDHVKLQQTYNGIPIADAIVLVHSNKENQVTMVQNNYIEGFQPSNQEQLSAESAMEIVRNDLRANLRSSVTLSEVKAERLIAPYQKAHYYAWNVVISSRNPLGLWVYRVDASTGQILHKTNRIRSLSGSGSVYKTNADYSSNPQKITNQTLPNLLPVPSTDIRGYLFGTHAAIYNYKGDANPPPTPPTPPYANTLQYVLPIDPNEPFTPNLHFYYDPVASADFFDAVNAYYKVNLIWNWWNQNVVPKNVNNKTYPDSPQYVPYFSQYYPIPVIVNETDNAACDSFYDPDIFGNNSMQPGFVFGKEDTCTAPIVPVSFANENFVLDEDVVAHEFTHFMVDQCGFTASGGQFADPEYGDAMNEGNADFWAFLRTKNTLMGDVICHASSGDWPCDASPTPPYYMRSVNNAHMYPTNVDDPEFNPAVPEAHYTGQIWSGYLHDLYKILGNQTLNFVFQGFYYFASPMAGFSGAVYAQYLAEKDVNPSVPLSMKGATGAEASRGLNAAVGPCYYNQALNVSDGPVGTAWEFPPTTSINTKGYFHNPGDKHEYWVEVDNATMNLNVTVTSVPAAPKMTNPVIKLYYINRDDQNIVIDQYSPTGCAAVAPITTGSSSLTSAQLNWPRLGAGLYSIVVTGTGIGSYNFRLSLR